MFQGPAPELYGSLDLSMRTMFDYTLGEYEPQNLPRNDYSHSVLKIIHLIVSNIFLLNYLIAILSTVYVVMKEIGDFKYKANRYAYIEKFQVPFLDTNGYEEFVIYPSPINLLTIGLIPFMFQKSDNRYSNIFSKCMFWIENFFFILGFFVYLVIMMPLIYFRLLYHFFRSMKWYNFLWIGIIWVIFGVLILPFYVVKDMYYFLQITSDDGLEKSAIKKLVKDEQRNQKLQVYSEIYEVTKFIYT